MKYVVTVPEIVLPVETLASFTSIYPITIPQKPVFASSDAAAYYASNYNLLGSTKLVSGSLTDLQSDNEVYMDFRSYDSAFKVDDKLWREERGSNDIHSCHWISICSNNGCNE